MQYEVCFRKLGPEYFATTFVIYVIESLKKVILNYVYFFFWELLWYIQDFMSNCYWYIYFTYKDAFTVLVSFIQKTCMVLSGRIKCK